MKAVRTESMNNSFWNHDWERRQRAIERQSIRIRNHCFSNKNKTQFLQGWHQKRAPRWLQSQKQRPPNPKPCPRHSSFFWESWPHYLCSSKGSLDAFFLSYLRPEHEITKGIFFTLKYSWYKVTYKKHFLTSHGTTKSKLESLNNFSQDKGNVF